MRINPDEKYYCQYCGGLIVMFSNGTWYHKTYKDTGHPIFPSKKPSMYRRPAKVETRLGESHA